jgi:hypothetical protein
MTVDRGDKPVLSIEIYPSEDATTLNVSIDGGVAHMSAGDVDALIRDLAAARARMTPIHSAVPPDDPEKLHHSDNLLWTVKAAPEKSAIQFATQHPGLGWTSMWLSRAQVEDLQTSFEFELVKLPQAR